MGSPGTPRPARLFEILLLASALCVPAGTLPQAASRRDGGADFAPGTILSALRPDYRRYIGEMRPMEMNGLIEPAMRAIYMALVKPGATDPTRRESAPLTRP